MIDAFDRLLADIQELAPAIAARAPEIEAGRRIPVDLIETLRSAGLFRMLVPKSHGGLELDLREALDIITLLCRIEGSVGWAAVIGAGSAVFPALHPRETYDEIYRHGPDVIFAASAAPMGKAEKVDGGWRVTGRWPFASGCQHADWIYGACIMHEDGKPLPGPAEGAPLVRVAVLPARQWRIEDTWYVAGLRGTGSHHVALDDTFVPQGYFLDMASDQSCLPGPLYYAPRQLISIMHNAVAIGIAEGALDDLVQMANSGRRQQRAATPMRESEVFRHELGRIEADLRAARAFHEVQMASHWRHAKAGTLNDETQLIQGIQSSVWIATTCVRVADTCFTLGGGSALYDNSPLQRRMRDLHAAAQHFAVSQRHYGPSGTLLLDSSARSALVV
ncbi:MAG TPA: acyl-CoA dehydrogenase family protein [Aliidongia sp.]|nr:acyl-CoA dehydrogenase family protein [Aliidongia sp.]